MRAFLLLVIVASLGLAGLAAYEATTMPQRDPASAEVNAPLAAQPPLRDGATQLEADLLGERIEVFAYRPEGCAPIGVLLVFTGVNRKAEGVRDRARGLSDDVCLIVFVPLFDKERFPNWRYHRAGVVRKGRVTPREEWTTHQAARLVGWAREVSGIGGGPLYLFGHSAGGQFVSRITAYGPPEGVKRFVVANPSLHVWPDLEEPAPNGFGGIFKGEEARERLRAYLAAPVTIYVGEEDVRSRYLVTTEPAMRQGEHRRERAHRVFAAARELAARRGWPFGWRLVEARGVGHSSGDMLNAPEAREALGLGRTPG